MSVEIITNFNLNAPLPLDNRSVVATQSDLTTIPATRRYHGMRVWVIADAKSYFYTVSNTWSPELPPASSSNVQSVGGTVGFLPKYTSVGGLYQINNSIISDNGSTATITGMLNVTNSITTNTLIITTSLNLGVGIIISANNIATLPLSKLTTTGSTSLQIIKNVSGVVSWSNNDDIYISTTTSNQFRPVLFSGDGANTSIHRKINIGATASTLRYNPSTQTLSTSVITASSSIITIMSGNTLSSTTINNSGAVSTRTLSVNASLLSGGTFLVSSSASSTNVILRGNVSLSSTNGIPIVTELNLTTNLSHQTTGSFFINSTMTGIIFTDNPGSVLPIPAKNYDRFIVFGNNDTVFNYPGGATYDPILRVAFKNHWDIITSLESKGQFRNGQCYVYVPSGTEIFLSLTPMNVNIIVGSTVKLIIKEFRLG